MLIDLQNNSYVFSCLKNTFNKTYHKWEKLFLLCTQSEITVFTSHYNLCQTLELKCWNSRDLEKELPASPTMPMQPFRTGALTFRTLITISPMLSPAFLFLLCKWRAGGTWSLFKRRKTSSPSHRVQNISLVPASLSWAVTVILKATEKCRSPKSQENIWNLDLSKMLL